MNLPPGSRIDFLKIAFAKEEDYEAARQAEYYGDKCEVFVNDPENPGWCFFCAIQQDVHEATWKDVKK